MFNTFEVLLFSFIKIKERLFFVSRITRVIAFLEDRESHAIIRSGAFRIGVALNLVTDSSDNE